MIRFFVAVSLLVPLSTVAAGFGDAAKGQAISQTCAACHGADGNSLLPMNPVLAGQHPEYLYKQLTNFKSGERQNAIMAGMVANLTDDDMRNLAAFYASQKPAPSAARDKALVTQGQKIFRGGITDTGVASCAGCHSPNGAGNPIEFPRLAGQHAEYVSNQLRAFRAGQRGNDPNRMMRMVASRLTDNEIAALAEYITGLR